ncbi:hypothetical protein GCM10027589_40420 [Actinocorallia lasiicapitis]
MLRFSEFAGFLRRPAGLEECRGGRKVFGDRALAPFRGRVHDPSGAIVEIAGGLAGADEFRGGVGALICGVLVCDGGAAGPALGPILNLLEH